MKYSIWLIPNNPVYSNLKSIIYPLADANNAPRFEPHLTLLGDIEGRIPDITDKMQTLVKDLKDLELTLSEVSISTTFFQSVFVRIKSTSALMQLNLDAKKLFKTENNVFMPHISLFYGGSLKEREEIAGKINLERDSFRITKMVLAPVTEDPKDWKILAEINL